MIPNQRKMSPVQLKDNGPRPRPDEPCSDAAALFHHSAMYRPTVPLPHPPMDLIGKPWDMNIEVAGISHQGHRYEQVWKITTYLFMYIYICIYCFQFKSVFSSLAGFALNLDFCLLILSLGQQINSHARCFNMIKG